MPEDLQPIALREAIELEHDRWIEGRHVAMPDVASHTSEKDVGVTALKGLQQRQFRNRMLLPEIFAQKQSVDARRVAAHDHVLKVVGKNLGLDEIAGAQQIRHRLRLADAADRPFPEPIVVSYVSAFELFTREAGNLFAVAKSKMACDIRALEPGQCSQPDIIKLREKERVHEMAAVDRELGVVDRLLRNLQPRRPRSQKSTAPAPIQFGF